MGTIIRHTDPMELLDNGDIGPNDLVYASENAQPWNGNYLEPEEQMVISDDAEALADSLNMAMMSIDIPVGVQRSMGLLARDDEGWPEMRPAHLHATPKLVHQVIHLARRGRFCIDSYEILPS